jgi:ferric-dicitrate binding protein FerR (iron transport regulator)
MKNKEQIKDLLRQYMSGTAGDAAQRALKEVLADDGLEGLVTAALEELVEETGGNESVVPEEWYGMHRFITGIDKPLPGARRVPLFRRWSWAAAAAVLLVAAGYLWLRTDNRAVTTASVKSVQDTAAISPGTYGAVLTLADGSTVVLDSLGDGTIAAQAGTSVSLAGGQLAYAPAEAPLSEVVWNTMTTARGRQFRLVLPDGSRVWLNAASSIRYPTAFTAKNRVVELQGEAYFEIARNPEQPFRVALNPETEVQVLGTAFNVSNYAGGSETTRTTLVEGAVRIRSFNHSQILKPGEQAWTAPAGNIQVVGNVDTEQVLAWKNGLFNFNGAGIKEVMQQLERWYDIEVKYEGAVTAERFKGEMQRGLQFSEVLESLKYMGVKCRLEGRTLVVAQ